MRLSEECWVWKLRNKQTPVKESGQPSLSKTRLPSEMVTWVEPGASAV